MSRIHRLVLTALCCVSLCGCPHSPEPSTTPDITIDGIKIDDVAPSNPTPIPVRIVFRILSFDVAASRCQTVHEALSKLEGDQITFVNYQAFRANNLLAAFGRADKWSGIAEVLSEVKALTAATENLIVYNDLGDDFGMTITEVAGVITFVEPDGREITDEYSPGRFSWILRARPIQSVRGVAQIEVRPAYRLGVDSFISRLAQYRDLRPFDGGAFGLKMSAGDFVMLAPGQIDKSGKVDLSTMLFHSPEDDSLVRLYLIGCMGVDN